MKDQIIIEALELDLVVGVHSFEKKFRQRLYLDLTLSHCQLAAARDDDLHQTLDYAEICETLREYAASRGAQGLALLETLAEEMAALLLQRPAVSAVSMTLRKPGAVASCASVGVRIVREAAHGTL